MLYRFLEKEKYQLPCFIPIFIAVGILLSFYLSPYIFNNKFLAAIILILICFGFISQNILFKVLAFAISGIIAGILALQIRISHVDSPIIGPGENFYWVKGQIENITPLEHGQRLIINKVKIWKLSPEKTPKRIRITVRTKLNDAKVGNYVKLAAILNPPMQPYLDNSFNFARDAFFKRIGAIGYSVTPMQILNNGDKNFLSSINYLRNSIQNRVNQSVGSYYGSIITALMINEYSNIDKQILANLRASGLSHILSVSGMHLSIVTTIFFFVSRILINLWPWLALRCNSKKIAGIVALIGSTAYLLISGMEVAAIRSYLMSSMIIIAIIIDRLSDPMRTIAFAATIILIINPENIIHPSFQMSFSAVLGLISAFSMFSKIKFNFSEFNFLQKILFYLLSICLASLVAGLATMPFALYHFSQSSNYSILANLLAIPITSFWLMPCVVICFLLYPLHLEHIGLKLFEPGIKLLVAIADLITKFPHSVSHFAKPDDLSLLTVALGMLCFFILKSKIKFVGISLILFAMAFEWIKAKPEIFIDWENKKIAVLNQQQKLIFITKPLIRFKKQLLLNFLGLKTSQIYKPNQSSDLFCEEKICILHKDTYQVEFNLDSFSIDISKNKTLLKTIKKQRGTSFIYLSRENDERY